MAPISDMAPIPEHDLLGASRSTIPNQVRTASAPTLPTSLAASASPPAANLSNSRLSSIPHIDEWPAVRKSSIDSALSSLLSQPSQSRKSSEDSVTSNLADIANLSSAAGSPEAAIQYLLKEKQSSAAQNAQLWRLVDKQRTMILGLNRDLERALSDKERYRKKLKEHLAHCSYEHNQHHAKRPDPEANAVPAAAAMAAPLPPKSLTPQPPSANSSEQSTAASDDLRGDRTTLSTTGDPEHAACHGKNANMIRAPHGPTPPASRENSVSAREDAPRSSKPGVAVSRAAVPPSHNGRAVPLSPEESETASEKRGLSPDGASPTSQTADDPPPRQPHAGRPHVAPLEKPPEVPFLSLSEPSPPMIEPRRGSGSTARKAPPAPLKLTQSKPVAVRLQSLAPDEHSGSEYDDFIEKEDVPQVERGRRRTREEDDRMRELALAKEQERRSLSKKEKGSKSAPKKPAAATTLQVSDAAPPNLLDAAPVLLSPFRLPPHLAAPNTAAATTTTTTFTRVALDASADTASDTNRGLPLNPLSPGLPSSPRPTDRPPNSPQPRLPRGEYHAISSPLTSPHQATFGLAPVPRAPMQPLMHLPPRSSSKPPNLPAPDPTPPEPETASSSATESRDGEPKQSPKSISSMSKLTFRNLPAGETPGSFLNKGILPLIDVKVSSSRLRPFRSSSDGSKTRNWEQNAAITLGVYAKRDGAELWQVEKDVASLSRLDQELRGLVDIAASLPDRSLFSGHAPARVDARRAVLDRYFDSVMHAASDNQVAMVLCLFLTKNIVEADGRDSKLSFDSSRTSASYLHGSDARVRKEGYLTKRGKNFGGWKARFFLLDGPTLRYYESPGGPHLGTIRLKHARVGKQFQQASVVPTINDESPDAENEYRHAFLIDEPKKKDSTSYVRHLLCAESDAERDEWVAVLMCYIDESESEDEASPTSAKQSSNQTRKKHAEQPKGFTRKESPHGSLYQETLRGVSYEDTVAADPPVQGGGEAAEDGSPAPLNRPHISGPKNGAKIEDAGAWGNRLQPTNGGEKREQKKRSIWGFKNRASAEPLLQLQQNSPAAISGSPQHVHQHYHHQHHHHQQQQQQQLDGSTNGGSRPVRPVFGVPLAEAVEHARPLGMDISIPAVVYRCIEYLDAMGAAQEEGIFRLSGASLTIKALRQRFDIEGDVNFLTEEERYDVHAVASLLKQYLRELPSSVLTRELHLDFLQVLGKHMV